MLGTQIVFIPVVALLCLLVSLIRRCEMSKYFDCRAIESVLHANKEKLDIGGRV